MTRLDLLIMAASAVSSVSLCWLVFAVLTDGVGWFCFWVVAYFLFLAIYFVASYDRVGWLGAVDRVVTVAVARPWSWCSSPWSGWSLHRRQGDRRPSGRPSSSTTQTGITPTMPATAGGGLHAIVGTIEQVGHRPVVSLPLGAMTAVLLEREPLEAPPPCADLRRRHERDALHRLGLFIYATLIIPLAKYNSLFSFNGFMASLALSVTMMPTICRAIEVVLRLVPAGLREAGLALGASRAKVVWSVVLPTASSGVATAAILGIAREAGETAPLLFTAFGYNLMNANPFHGAQESLPLFIYRFIREPSPLESPAASPAHWCSCCSSSCCSSSPGSSGGDRTKARRRPKSVEAARRPLPRPARLAQPPAPGAAKEPS